ncbi:NAD-dependent DNA ligase [Aeromonas phage ZPAH1]|nr:NAD-dependent DNA ligase [Aeromonas phage ZPAH1]
MNAAELVKQIGINQKEREKDLPTLSKTLYDQIVKEMLDMEVTFHIVESRDVDNFLFDAGPQVTIGRWDFIRQYLIPEFKKNGFDVKCVYESIEVSVKNE